MLYDFSHSVGNLEEVKKNKKYEIRTADLRTDIRLQDTGQPISALQYWSCLSTSVYLGRKQSATRPVVPIHLLILHSLVRNPIRRRKQVPCNKITKDKHFVSSCAVGDSI
jgi:hypothetical protein